VILTRELQRQEVRRLMSPLDPVERDAEYAATDNPTILDAMETAPPIPYRIRPDAPVTLTPFVTPKLVAARREARAFAADPIRAAEVRDLEGIGRLYGSTLAMVRNGLAEAVPELRNDAPIDGGSDAAV
jgi:hypothetical protein